MKCEQHKYHQYIICCVFYNTNNIITTRYTATATNKTSIIGACDNKQVQMKQNCRSNCYNYFHFQLYVLQL